MTVRPTRSISAQLTTMNMLLTGAALVLACTAFLTYDQVTSRQGLLRTLSAQAQIIGSNSVSALLSNDPLSASNTLSALKNSPNVASAVILTTDRRLFAMYTRQGEDEMVNVPTLRDDQIEANWFRRTHAVLIRKILSGGQLVGFVCVRADLGEIDKQLWRYVLISAVVLLVCLMFTLLVSSRFSKSVSEPIIVLAETARKVSRDQDYSVRVIPSSDRDELATLMNSFNEMLREIQL